MINQNDMTKYHRDMRNSASMQSGMTAPMGVADRVNQITSQNSPIMRRAETRGMQQSGRRGLLNSSMGVQAAQAAVIDAATPMAQTDAQLDNSRFMQTRDFGQRDKEQDRDIDFRNKEFAERTRQFNVGFEFDKDKFAEDKRQFGEKFALEKQGLLQNQTQFQMGYDLDREKLAENRSQFQMGYNLDDRRLTQDQANADRAFGLDERQANNQQTNVQMQAAQNIESLAAQLMEAAQREGLPQGARQDLINRATAMRESNYALMQQLYPELSGLDWATVSAPYDQAEEEQKQADASLENLPKYENKSGDPRRDDPDWEWKVLNPRTGSGRWEYVG